MISHDAGFCMLAGYPRQDGGRPGVIWCWDILRRPFVLYDLVDGLTVKGIKRVSKSCCSA